jgi:hypothetical protein
MPIKPRRIAPNWLFDDIVKPVDQSRCKLASKWPLPGRASGPGATADRNFAHGNFAHRDFAHSNFMER